MKTLGTTDKLINGKKSEIGSIQAAEIEKWGIVTLDYSHVPLNSNWIRAFVQTDSLNQFILTSLSELYGAVPQSVFCCPREWGGNKGILITMFFDVPINKDFGVALVVLQLGAKQYKPPVIYMGAH